MSKWPKWVWHNFFKVAIATVALYGTEEYGRSVVDKMIEDSRNKAKIKREKNERSMNDEKMLAHFDKFEVQDKPLVYIPRPEVKEKIKKAIESIGKIRKPILIAGDRGVGKTSLVKEIAIELKVGGIYVSCEEDLNLAFEKRLGLDLNTNNVVQANFDSVLNQLEIVAKRYKNKKGYIPLLMVDNIDRKAEENKDLKVFIQKLLGKVKVWRDNEVFRVIFASTNGVISHQLAIDMDLDPICFQLKDLDDEAVRTALMSQKCDPKYVEKFIKDIGPRALYLQEFLLFLKQTETSSSNPSEIAYDKIKAVILEKNSLKFVKLFEHIKSGSEEEKKIKEFLKAMLNSRDNSMNREESSKILGNDQLMSRMMVNYIVAQTVDDQNIYFENKLMTESARKQLKIRETFWEWLW